MSRVEQIIEHRGALEVSQPENGGEKVVERMTVVTRGGLLQRGDRLPMIYGLKAEADHTLARSFSFNLKNPQKPTILGFVNKFDTEVCDEGTREMERIHAATTGEVLVVQFSKQSSRELSDYTKRKGIKHLLVSIDADSAVDLGVALKSDTDESGELLAGKFWNGALCRTLIVVGMNGLIEHIEQLMDQAKQVDYEAAELTARNLLAR